MSTFCLAQAEEEAEEEFPLWYEQVKKDQSIGKKRGEHPFVLDQDSQ